MLAHLTGSARFSLARREQAERFKHPAHVKRFTVLHSAILALLINNDLIFLEKIIFRKKKYKNVVYLPLAYLPLSREPWTLPPIREHGTLFTF